MVYHNPVAVQVGMNSRFRHYRGGLFDDTSCPYLEDGWLTVIGYDENAYFCLNSWGENWGVYGLIYIRRGETNMERGVCGILRWAFAPLHK